VTNPGFSAETWAEIGGTVNTMYANTNAYNGISTWSPGGDISYFDGNSNDSFMERGGGFGGGRGMLVPQFSYKYWEFPDGTKSNPYDIKLLGFVMGGPLQSLFDQVDLNEFVDFFFGKEFAQVSEKYKLTVEWDYIGFTTSKKPGNTTPLWNKNEIRISLNQSVLKDARLLYSVLGHEFVHAMDIANGNLRFWNRMVNGNFEKLEALMEFHAYQWSVSTEKGLGVNFGGQNGYLVNQGLLGYFGIKFSLPPQ
jgi:hypothetical protein